MMRPKFDDADLAAIEFNATYELLPAPHMTVLNLIHEIRIYQDLLLEKQAECDLLQHKDCEVCRG